MNKSLIAGVLLISQFALAAQVQSGFFDNVTKTELSFNNSTINSSDSFFSSAAQSKACFKGDANQLVAEYKIENSPLQASLTATAEGIVASIEYRTCTQSVGGMPGDSGECVAMGTAYAKYVIQSCEQLKDIRYFSQANTIDSDRLMLPGQYKILRPAKTYGTGPASYVWDVYSVMGVNTAVSGEWSKDLTIYLRFYSHKDKEYGIFSEQEDVKVIQVTSATYDALEKNGSALTDGQKLVKVNDQVFAVETKAQERFTLPMSILKGEKPKAHQSREPQEQVRYDLKYKKITMSKGQMSLRHFLIWPEDNSTVCLKGSVDAFNGDMNLISGDRLKYNPATMKAEFLGAGACLKQVCGAPSYPGDDGCTCQQYDLVVQRTVQFGLCN